MSGVARRQKGGWQARAECAAAADGLLIEQGVFTMKKHLLLLTIVACILGGLSSVAGAETIEVTNIGPEELNIQAVGRITFEELILGQRITCDKTMTGRLVNTTIGVLGLGNVGGIIGEVRFANCVGGTVEARLIELAFRPANLSWVRVERRTIELGASSVRLLVTIPGAAACLYTALLAATSTAEARGLFRTITLRLVRFTARTRLSGFLCPSEAEVVVSGTLTLTRPAAGVGVSLR